MLTARILLFALFSGLVVGQNDASWSSEDEREREEEEMAAEEFELFEYLFVLPIFVGLVTLGFGYVCCKRHQSHDSFDVVIESRYSRQAQLSESLVEGGQTEDRNSFVSVRLTNGSEASWPVGGAGSE